MFAKLKEKLFTKKQTSYKVIFITLNEIYPNPYQPRKNFSDETIDELAKSIKTYGILQPIVVRKFPKGYQIICGERRVRAAKRLSLENVPAIIKQVDDTQILEIAFLENLHRENLNELDLAQALDEIVKNNSLNNALSLEDISKKLGTEKIILDFSKEFLALPYILQRAVVKQIITKEQAKELTKIENEEEMLNIIRKIYVEGLSLKETKSYLEKILKLEKALPVVKSFLELLENLIDTVRALGININTRVNNKPQDYEIILNIEKEQEKNNHDS